MGTHSNAAFASVAFIGVFNNHMLVKPDIHFPEYIVFAGFDTIPAGLTLAGIQVDILCASSF